MATGWSYSTRALSSRPRPRGQPVATSSPLRRPLSTVVPLMVGALLGLTACNSKTTSMNHANLTDFAVRYAAAWSSQHPDSLAAFYSEHGSLTVNAGAPSVGRAAITATAEEYMTALRPFGLAVTRNGKSAPMVSSPSRRGIPTTRSSGAS